MFTEKKNSKQKNDDDDEEETLPKQTKCLNDLLIFCWGEKMFFFSFFWSTDFIQLMLKVDCLLLRNNTKVGIHILRQELFLTKTYIF